MTFQDIYNEVITARFKASQTDSIKRWINLRDAQIWASAEWPWKIVGPTSLTVTTGDATPTLPTDIQIPTALYDDQGGDLVYCTQRDFDRAYLSGATGRPVDYKWNNGVLTLGPTPDRGYTYTITYNRSLSHYNDSDVLTLGPMSADGDYPVYDEEWHEILTIGAISTGLKIENDPTWESLEQEFAFMVEMMKEHYLPSVSVASNMQYGANGL